MKVFIPQRDKLNEKRGGGWSFVSTLCKYAKWAEFVGDPLKADIYLVAGASMITDIDEVNRAKRAGAKIVLRVDNALKNSNNRNSGMTKMKALANISDAIIYQSQWARDYLKDFVGKDGAVILNGIDQEIFKPNDDLKEPNTFLYTRSSRDEQKGWHLAWMKFQELYRENKDRKLYIVGKFSGDNIGWSFDFFSGEKWEYLGFIGDPYHMAIIYQRAQNLLYTQTFDACSNSLIESLSCNCMPLEHYALGTGGAKEIITQYQRQGREYFSAERMCAEYREILNNL